MKKSKLLSAATALALTLSLAPGALAENTNADINLVASVSERQQLINSLDFSETITQNEINSLSTATLIELSKEPGEIVSIQGVERNMDNGNLSGITPFTMPKTDFDLQVVAQRNDYKGSSYDSFRFIATGIWKETPFFEFTDKIALSWSDDFTLAYSYANVYDRNGDALSGSKTLKSEIDPEKGVAYDVNLKVGDDDREIVLVAQVYKNNSTGTANVVAEYGHVEIAPKDITVGFSGSKSGAEISMSVGWGANLEKASPDSADFDY